MAGLIPGGLPAGPSCCGRLRKLISPSRHVIDLRPVPRGVRNRRADLDHQRDDPPHNEAENPKAPAGKEADAEIQQRGGAGRENNSTRHHQARLEEHPAKPQSPGKSGLGPEYRTQTQQHRNGRGEEDEEDVCKELLPKRSFFVGRLKAQREIDLRQHALEIAQRRNQRILRPWRSRADDDDRTLQDVALLGQRTGDALVLNEITGL